MKESKVSLQTQQQAMEKLSLVAGPQTIAEGVIYSLHLGPKEANLDSYERDITPNMEAYVLVLAFHLLCDVDDLTGKPIHSANVGAL